MKKILMGVTLALMGSCAVAYAAEPVCGTTVGLLETFEKDYGEVPIFYGLSVKGYLSMILVNPDSGSWTQFLVSPEGKACLLDVGEHAETVRRRPNL